MPIRLLAVLFAILSYSHLNASHLLGGNMTYTHDSGTTYTVSLTLYRDCSSQTPFDGTPASTTDAIVGLFSGADSLINVYAVDSPIISSVIPSLDSQCIYPYPFCMEKGVYTFSVTLPDSGVYTLVHERCCLSGTLNNIFDPGSYGFIISAKIQAGNNSPLFNITPPLFVSVNDSFSFDNWCVDPDGDSLSYSLVTPFSGGDVGGPAPNPPAGPPFDTIHWQSGFASYKPLGSDTALTLDTYTGSINGVAPFIGSFLIGVKVTEHRNGQVISEYPLSFTLNVTDCNYHPDTATAIEENEQKKIVVFPNPARSEVIIEGLGNKQYSVKLTDLAGKLLLQQTLSAGNNVLHGLNQFSAGMYLLEFSNGLKRRIIIE